MGWPRKGDGRRALKKRRPEAPPQVRSTHAAARWPADSSGTAEASGSADGSRPATAAKTAGRGAEARRGSAASGGTARGAHSTPTRITAAEAARSAKPAGKRAAMGTAAGGVSRPACPSTARTSTAGTSTAGTAAWTTATWTTAMRIKASARTDNVHLTRDQAAVRSDLAIDDDKMTTFPDNAAGILDPDAACRFQNGVPTRHPCFDGNIFYAADRDIGVAFRFNGDEDAIVEAAARDDALANQKSLAPASFWPPIDNSPPAPRESTPAIWSRPPSRRSTAEATMT